MKKRDLLPALPTDPADILLADVAIGVQLSQTDYKKAVQRYRTIDAWIKRQESPLGDRVELLYPQGSMAIGATIASKLKTDEFDIDVVAQLDLPDEVSPRESLDLLCMAIRGEQGSRYYRMTERKTRCVTINYSDDMHLDVTPALRMRGTPERQSWIFHHPPEAINEPGCRLVANPYGFAEWFKRETPPDDDFADFFEERSADYELRHRSAKADSEPVPPQEPPFRKSKSVIVLQLLKRWRNVQYESRQVRRPPSIMIAKLVADVANHTDRLSEELLLQAKHMRSVFCRSHSRGQCIHIVNPVCAEDVLTDRWPRSLQDQARFIFDLEDLVEKVEWLVEGRDLEGMQEILVRLFGEAPAKEAVRAFNRRTGSEVGEGHSRYDSVKGGLIIPASTGCAVGSSVARRPPKHTFYGTERKKR